jgi:hypothetical protein
MQKQDNQWNESVKLLNWEGIRCLSSAHSGNPCWQWIHTSASMSLICGGVLAMASNECEDNPTLSTVVAMISRVQLNSYNYLKFLAQKSVDAIMLGMECKTTNEGIVTVEFFEI